MKHIIKMMKPYILALIVLIAFTYGSVMANLRLPDYMANIINNGIIAQNLDSI